MLPDPGLNAFGNELCRGERPGYVGVAGGRLLGLRWLWNVAPRQRLAQQHIVKLWLELAQTACRSRPVGALIHCPVAILRVRASGAHVKGD